MRQTIHCFLALFKHIVFHMPFVGPYHQEHNLSSFDLYRVRVGAAHPLDSTVLCLTDEPVVLLLIPLLFCVSGFTLCCLLILLQVVFWHLQAVGLTYLLSPWKDIPLLAVFASPVHQRK